MRRWMTLGCLLAALSPGAAHAQRFDIAEQDVRVDLSGGTVRVAIDATVDRIDGAVIQAAAFGLPVESARIDGIEVTARPHAMYPEYVTELPVPPEAMSSRRHHVEVALAGTPRCGSSFAPGLVVCWHSELETILTAGGPGSAWYLDNVLELDAFGGSVAVRAPNDFVVAAGQGPAVDAVDEGDGTTTWTFDVTRAVSGLGMYAGRGAVARSQDGSFPASAYYRPGRDDPERVQTAVDLASELMPVFGEMFGVDALPEARMIVVPRDAAFGGMGLLGTVFFGEYVVGELDFLLEQGVAHELAHSWWGGVSSAPDPAEGRFLQEAFAEYSAWRALGELWGEPTRVTGNRMNAVWYMYRRPEDQDVAILDPAAQRHPAVIHVSYHKGSQVLRLLEEAAGTDAFGAALSAVVTRGPLGHTVDGFLADLEAASGRSLRAIAEPWLFETGYPVLRVARTEAGLAIEVEGDYELPLSVRITTATGETREERVTVFGGANEVTFEPGVLVEVDPRWTMAREVVPALEADVSLDGRVDAVDLIEVALRSGTYLPDERRRDGGYDPLYDLDGDGLVSDADLQRALDSAAPFHP